MNGLAVPLEQRMTALHRANEIRCYRAKKKKEVRSGEERYDFFLVCGPHDPMLATMKIRAALVAMPGIWHKKADRILTRAGISPAKTLGGVTQAQWERLYVVLEKDHPGITRRLRAAVR